VLLNLVLLIVVTQESHESCEERQKAMLEVRAVVVVEVILYVQRGKEGEYLHQKKYDALVLVAAVAVVAAVELNLVLVSHEDVNSPVLVYRERPRPK